MGENMTLTVVKVADTRLICFSFSQTKRESKIIDKSYENKLETPED